jgi:hypothetical protein
MKHQFIPQLENKLILKKQLLCQKKRQSYLLPNVQYAPKAREIITIWIINNMRIDQQEQQKQQRQQQQQQQLQQLYALWTTRRYIVNWGSIDPWPTYRLSPVTSTKPSD